MRLVLASASPRRRELLSGAGLRFEVLPPSVPEDDLPGGPPAGVARTLAVRKARAAAGALDGTGPALVLGADTVVALDGGRLLGKPADRAEAAAHLRSLSGTTHSVVTGVCLLEVPGGREEVFHSETRVTMRSLDEGEIDAYAGSGEGLDKAGGYAIQEGGDRFVTRLEGSRTGVVGLPLEEVLDRLAARGIRP